jgi:hypothetical protein
MRNKQTKVFAYLAKKILLLIAAGKEANMKPNLIQKTLSTITIVALMLAVLATLSRPVTSAAQTESVEERVAALKRSLAESQLRLKQYEWIETTVVSLKGEEKSRKQNRCYYGADGVLQKVPVSASVTEDKKRGLRGRIAEHKKEELTEYMQQAVDLVKSYVPPTPARIQAVKDAGKVSVDLIEPGKRIRLNFRDYLKPGDTLGVELDPVNNRLLGLKVTTYLEDPQDSVDLDVRFGLLADSTSYPQQITLDAPAKEVQVTVENSGYRKLGN